MAQTFNTILSFVKSTSRKDRRKGIGSLSVSAVAGGGVGNVADSATQAWVRDNFVDKTTEQEISALKIFSQGIKIGDISLFKHPDGYVYLDSSLVLSGGVTMYGDDGTTVKPIWESIPLDESTLAWIDGNLSVVGGVGSGGISEEFLNVTLQGYQPLLSTTNKLPYSLISGTPDLSVYFLSANFTKANIKSTLGISDWALASTKPPYTASEVGALASNATAVDSSSLGGYASTTYMRASGQYADSLNDLTKLGIYRMGGTITDGPTGAGPYGNLMVVRSNGWDTLAQLYFNVNNNRVSVRSGSNTSYLTRGWSTLAFTSDIPTKLSQLTDDVVAGNYLPLSGGAITGKLAFTGASFPHIYGDGSKLVLGCANIETYGSIVLENNSLRRNGSAPNITLGTNSYKWKHIYGNGLTITDAATFASSVTAPTFIGNLTGNADSATKLATPRTIWGQSFDGTGNITGAMTVDGNAIINGVASVIYRYGTSTDGTAILSVGSYKSNPYGLIFYSNGVQASSIQSQLFDNSLYTTLCLNHKGGNVAIGGTTADAKLHVHGTAKFTDDTTFSSKVVIGTIPVYQSADGTLFVNANVVFRGGVAMYGNTTTTINEE